MPITINGTNGITFNDTTVQNKGLTVVNFTRKIWSTRYNPGDFNSKQYPEGWQNLHDDHITIERVHPKSILLVKWTMSMQNNYSDCLSWRGSWGGEGWYQATMPYDAGFTANARPFYTTMWMNNLPQGSLGSKNLLLEYRAANGNTGERPSTVINPNRREDDERYPTNYSSVTVFELAR